MPVSSRHSPGEAIRGGSFFLDQNPVWWVLFTLSKSPVGQGVAFDGLEDQVTACRRLLRGRGWWRCWDDSARQSVSLSAQTACEALFVLGKLLGEGLDGDFPSEFGHASMPHLDDATFSEVRNDFIARKC